MERQTWSAVDDYIGERLVQPDRALVGTLAGNAQAGLPAIDVSAAQGKLLHLLARVQGARRVLEIGTLGGYSTIWLARALPADGRLVTLEVDPHHAAVARANLDAAGVGDLVDVRIGPAIETLPRLVSESAGPFDLVFIDADKEQSADYVTWALELVRVGALVIVDNVVRGGAVADTASADPRVLGARRLFDLLAGEPRLTSTALQTVGSKGYDGLTISLVVG